MSEVLDFLFGLALLIFTAYLVIFGGIGALLSRHRDGSLVAGFVVGLVPIVGLPLVLWITRSSKRRISADNWLGPDEVRGEPDTPEPRTPQTSPAGLPPAVGSDPHDY